MLTGHLAGVCNFTEVSGSDPPQCSNNQIPPPITSELMIDEGLREKCFLALNMFDVTFLRWFIPNQSDTHKDTRCQLLMLVQNELFTLTVCEHTGIRPFLKLCSWFSISRETAIRQHRSVQLLAGFESSKRMLPILAIHRTVNSFHFIDEKQSNIRANWQAADLKIQYKLSIYHSSK